MMYLRFRLGLQCILLTTTISLSPVFGENGPQSSVNEIHAENGTPLVGPSILSGLPHSGSVVKSGFPSDPGGSGVKISSPGRTYGTLIAILAAAGGATALALLLTHGGQKQSSTPSPVITSVTTGAPVISAPPGH